MDKLNTFKNVIAKAFGILALTVLGTTGVSAIPVSIDGVISFGGTVSSNTADIKDATQLTFGGTFVTSATGDFAADGVGFGTGATFNVLDIPLPGGGVDPLWSVVGTSYTWEFALLAITSIDRSNSGFLTITGTGTGTSTWGDRMDTDGIWTLSADQNGATIAFSSTTSVPEPATLALLGLGLIGLGARRRNVSAV